MLSIPSRFKCEKQGDVALLANFLRVMSWYNSLLCIHLQLYDNNCLTEHKT